MTERTREQVEETRGAGHWLMQAPFGVMVIEHWAVDQPALVP